MSSLSDLNSLLNFLSETVHNTNITRYTAAIGFTVLCYDTLLTLGDEVRLIWTSRWGVAKCLFYLNRLISFAFLTFSAYHFAGYRPPLHTGMCKMILVGTSFAALAAFAMANWLLLLRVFALYGHKRPMLIGMSLFFFLTYGGTLALVILTTNLLLDQIHYSPIIHICIVDVRPNIMSFIWVPPIVLEFAIFFLASYKIVTQARTTASTRRSPVITILYRDGLLYFLIIMGLRVLNLIAWIVFPTSLLFVGFFMMWGIMTTLIARLFLNLRSLGNPNQAAWEDGEPIYSTTHPNASHSKFGGGHHSRGAVNTNIFGGGTVIRDDDRITVLALPGKRDRDLEEHWATRQPRELPPLRFSIQPLNNPGLAPTPAHHYTKPSRSKTPFPETRIELSDLSPSSSSSPSKSAPNSNSNSNSTTTATKNGQSQSQESYWSNLRESWEEDEQTIADEDRLYRKPSAGSSKSGHYVLGRAF